MTKEEYLYKIKEYHEMDYSKFDKLIAIRKIKYFQNKKDNRFRTVNYVYYTNNLGDLEYFPISDDVLLAPDERYIIFENMDIDIIYNNNQYNALYYKYNGRERFIMLFLYYDFELGMNVLNSFNLKNSEISIVYTRKNLKLIDNL